ncbi:TM2 domain-containing protein [Aquimarina intermedia]|uniref:TM2 domain-containing membrane protein YozV n=1 Tax=Aquimarina intermedia TaxID=350814 RepID=A0A5S5CAI6_9FLAO|nr:TM2 domain-containing protein [Aquimarina intermedia]TYP76159.1 TM2 domain-containing membrane protein YozV [Aquimarina intermedia]
MTDDKKNFGDDIEKGAKEVFESAKRAANEFSNEAKNTFGSEENKKLIAGILAIVLGWTGVHKFLLGYTKEGIIQILLSFLCGIGGIIGLIEGIIYLTKSDEEFYQTYQIGRKPWF